MAEGCTKAEAEALCSRCGHLVQGHDDSVGCLEESTAGFCKCAKAIVGWSKEWPTSGEWVARSPAGDEAGGLEWRLWFNGEAVYGICMIDGMPSPGVGMHVVTRTELMAKHGDTLLFYPVMPIKP